MLVALLAVGPWAGAQAEPPSYEIEQGVALADAQNPEIGYHLAVALDANGKRGEAKALLMSVLQANPKFDGVEDAKQLVARW